MLKPVGRKEVQHIWQHVWRRRGLAGGRAVPGRGNEVRGGGCGGGGKRWPGGAARPLTRRPRGKAAGVPPHRPPQAPASFLSPHPPPPSLAGPHSHDVGLGRAVDARTVAGSRAGGDGALAGHSAAGGAHGSAGQQRGGGHGRRWGVRGWRAEGAGCVAGQARRARLRCPPAHCACGRAGDLGGLQQARASTKRPPPSRRGLSEVGAALLGRGLSRWCPTRDATDTTRNATAARPRQCCSPT